MTQNIQSLSWHYNQVWLYLNVMELEYSLTCPQTSTTCPWPEPDDNFSPQLLYDHSEHFRICFRIILLSTPVFQAGSFFQVFLPKLCVCFSYVYICPAWFNHSNNTHWGVQIMKLLYTELFSRPLIHHPTLSQVFCTASYSWTLSVCVIS
jgi:hypothetical protein